MKTILVPVDFSDASFNSAHYAASLANIFNAAMILVHGYQNPGDIDEMPMNILNDPDRELQEIKEDLLNENIEILRKKFTIKISGIVKEGWVLDIIKETAKELNADLIVMGRKGKGKSNSVFGSTTTTLIRKSDRPVLVVPEGADFISLHDITLAVDFNFETSPGDYRFLRMLADKSDSFIYILNVRTKGLELSVNESSQKITIAHSFAHIGHDFFTIEDEDVDEGIEDFMDMHSSDLLVMIGHRRNFFERLFNKSNTKEMSEETRIPLLVLPDQNL